MKLLQTRVLSVLLLLSLLLSVVACGTEPIKPDPDPGKECTEHVDANKDGKCDNCGKEVAVPCDAHTDANGDGKCDVCGADVPVVPARTTLDLFDGNAACFRVVLAGSIGGDVRIRANSFVKAIRDMGITIDDPVADSDASKVQDCEIIIGSAPQNRPADCNIDAHSLGMRGYLIKVVGDRVVIVGGSDDATIQALEFFNESCLQIFEDSEKPGKTSIKCDYEKEHASRYSITEFTLDGVDLGAYTLVASKSDLAGKCYQYAGTLQNALYEYTGKWLDLVESDEGVEHPFYVAFVRNAGSTGFRVANLDGRVALECAYTNTFTRSLNEFIEGVLEQGFGKMTLDAGESFTEDAYKLYYSEFGAVNNAGKAESKYVDSFDALYATHEEANKYGQTVCGDDDWLYYIGQTTKTIHVRTNVNWGKASFIIDDRNVDQAHRGYGIFTIESEYNPVTLTKANYGDDYTLAKHAENIGFKLDYDAMVRTNWSGNKVYVRNGLNENSGSNQNEVLLVDRDGNIDESTAVLWDYRGMDNMTVYRIDDAQLVIEGGTFTTWANNQPRAYTYYSRNININRSNTLVKNIKHYIERETATGAPYAAFFNVNNANHVTLDGLLVTGHKMYPLEENPSNHMGTYDIQGSNSNDVTWKNISQSNSIVSTVYWGVHASNFCKNLTLLDSVISRFDAHQGMYNCTIKNSTLGQALNIIGAGLLYCENLTRVSGSNFAGMRSDYGSTWEGDVTLIDCKHSGYAGGDAYEPSGSLSTLTLFSGSYVANWNFGYKTYLPENLIIDNFEGPECMTYIFWNVPTNALTDPINPLTMPKKVTIRNVPKGALKICMNTQPFQNTAIVYEND